MTTNCWYATHVKLEASSNMRKDTRPLKVAAESKLPANPSLEATPTGRPPWPGSRRAFGHFRLPGQAALPAVAPQLKR
jgi:hypothetical protein